MSSAKRFFGGSGSEAAYTDVLRPRDKRPNGNSAKIAKFTISHYRRRLDSFELIILELVIELS